MRLSNRGCESRASIARASAASASSAAWRLARAASESLVALVASSAHTATGNSTPVLIPGTYTTDPFMRNALDLELSVLFYENGVKIHSWITSGRVAGSHSQVMQARVTD